MSTRYWLRRGMLLPDGSVIKKRLAEDSHWQIYLTSYDCYALAIDPALYQRWQEHGFSEVQLFSFIDVEQKPCYFFISRSGYLLSSAQKGPYPNTNVEARAFAVALRETRKHITDDSLHDAIYFEQFSRLLPTYTVSERLDDQTVLGSWLSGGVAVSASSFRRLCKLLNWMDSQEVNEIIQQAGFLDQKSSAEVKEGCEYEGNGQQKHSSFENKGRFLLPGRPKLEAFFNEHIVDIIQHEEKYRRMGIEFPAAVVLYGPPGCGKTYAIDRLIEFLDWPNYSIDSGSIGSPYIHDTSKKIAEVFDTAIDNAPAVVVIDEMEAFLTARETAMSSGQHRVEEVAEFLRRIPEAQQKRVLIVGMTNMIDLIDPAILRRGRFDHIIEVGMPSQEEISLLLTEVLKKLPTTDDIDIPQLAKALEGRPVSDVTFVLKEAGRNTVKQGRDSIDNDTFRAVINNLPPLPGFAKRAIGFSANDD